MWKQKSRDFVVEIGRYGRRSRRVRLWAAIVLLIVLGLSLQAIWPQWNLLPKLTTSLGAGTILAIFLAALFCEYIDSSLGMGYGTTLTPLLLLAGFEPLQVVPAVLLSEFITGFSAALLHHRDGNIDLLRDRKVQSVALSLGGLSVCGAVAAVTLALHIPKFWLTAIIATIIVSVGVVILATVRRRLAYRRSHMLVLGAVAAFNKGLSGGGYGPLVTGGQVVSGIAPKQAVAITSLAEGLTCLVGLTAYMVMRGNLDWALAVPLTVGAMLSVPMATLTVRRLPEAFMRASVGVVTCFLGLLAFIKLLC
ncbi:MAG: sulfite exporter TauE/SafE family protein [Phycisphaerae bacterium]|nr:sulfite exporter TauE/SafE family protein [Phycisphaerae bacterium]